MFKTYYLLSIVANICTIILFIIVVGYVFYVGIRILRIDAIKRKADKLWKELHSDKAEQMEDNKDNASEA